MKTDRLFTLWRGFYGEQSPEAQEEWAKLEGRLASATQALQTLRLEEDPQWYKRSVVYALYVQHFNKNFEGLISKLDYLRDLGVNCLWLLPILESPMRDEGFDVSDFYDIRGSLFSPETSSADRLPQFRAFLSEAHARGIRVIFDIALNHISIDHPWFRKAVEDPESPEHGYFHWSETGAEHAKARIIFKGMLESNWEFEPRVGKFYFHRFYPHQPDVNYANPRLMREILEALLFWIEQGVDGFRVDAAPYFWKDDSTESENHPKTHEIIRIMRAMTDAVRPSTLLLAEACQPPKEVVDYFGSGDECHGAYHFPLMPQIFLALSRGDAEPIQRVLSPRTTPATPEGAQWFTFLRCHDELTLEMVSPAERAEIHREYCRNPGWDFRQGEGISARLIELVQTPEKALLAHAILLGLAGTPVIYYGDEVLVPNNEAFNQSWRERTGYIDSRNLARGPLDWDWIQGQLADPSSPVPEYFRKLSALIRLREREVCFASTDQELVVEPGGLFGIRRRCPESTLELWYNLSDRESRKLPGTDLLRAAANGQGASVLAKEGFTVGGNDGLLAPLGFVWIQRAN